MTGHLPFKKEELDNNSVEAYNRTSPPEENNIETVIASRM